MTTADSNEAPPTFYETHAHLTFPDFAEELDAVVERAADAGVRSIVTIGTDQASSEAAVAIAERFPQVFAAIGWHPSDAEDAPADVTEALRALAARAQPVAIGEIGLDYYRLPSKTRNQTEDDDRRYKIKQAEVFEQQLELAAELGLNVVIHQRSSFDDTYAMMRRYADRLRGVFHCFVEDAGAQRRVQELGCLVSFTGIATFKSANTVRETIKATPLDQLMLETDCPFLAPVPFRGKRAEPAHVPHIAQLVAELKGVSLEALSAATCATAEGFFKGLKR